MAKEAKKKWTKPKLIVLTRGKPEEAALTLCKQTPTYDGPTFYQTKCVENTGLGGCVQCSAQGAS